ncbi:MAG: zinc protease [Pirellulaceae bacterium]|nr:MAG: zinc protease [Pirellulaceae bacterium]
MQFHRVTLPNGLEVLAEHNSQAYSTAIGYFVKTGARDEPPEMSGVSHFLEHMMFKGSQRRSADELNRELDEIGSHSNAYTSEEQTVYHAVLLPEYVDRAVELLSDMLRPALRNEDFDTEKKVILEEIAKYEDEPPFGVFEKAMAAHFPNHSLGRPILGTRQSVSALSVDQMRHYFENQYSPTNMALVATGNVDFEQLVKLAAKHAGHWEPFIPQRDPTRRQRVASRPSRQIIHQPVATQQYVLLVSDAPAAESPDRFAARLLATIVGDDSGSRLFWELVDTGRAESAEAGVHEFQGTGLMLTYLCCRPEDTPQNLRSIADIWQDVVRHGIKDDELERAKSKICSQIVLSSERAANRLFAVGSSWLTRGEYRSVRELVEQYRAVTADQIHRLLEQYPVHPCTVCAVGPLEELDTSRFGV